MVHWSSVTGQDRTGQDRTMTSVEKRTARQYNTLQNGGIDSTVQPVWYWHDRTSAAPEAMTVQ